MPRPSPKGRPAKAHAKKKQSGSKPRPRGGAAKQPRGRASGRSRTPGRAPGRAPGRTPGTPRRGRKANADLITARNLVLNLDPLPAPPARVTAIRAALGLSQAVFAQLMGVSVFALRSWEQGLRDPSFMARRLLDEMEAHPAHWFDLLQKAKSKK